MPSMVDKYRSHGILNENPSTRCKILPYKVKECSRVLKQCKTEITIITFGSRRTR